MAYFLSSLVMLLADKAVYAKCLKAGKPTTSGETTQLPANSSSIDGEVEGAEAIQIWHAVKQPSHGSWAMSNSSTQISGVGFRVAGCSYRSFLEIRWKETEGNRRKPPKNLVLQGFKMLKFSLNMCTKFSLVFKYDNDQKSLVYGSFPSDSVFLIHIYLHSWLNRTDFSSVNSLQLQQFLWGQDRKGGRLEGPVSIPSCTSLITLPVQWWSHPHYKCNRESTQYDSGWDQWMTPFVFCKKTLKIDKFDLKPLKEKFGRP